MSTQAMEHPELQFDLTDRLHKSLRIARKTASQIAEDLDAHRNTVSNYLGGRTQPDHATIAGWALATGVPISWLETGTLAPVPSGPGGLSPKEKSPYSPGAVRAAIASVVGIQIDMITFASICEAVDRGSVEQLQQFGYLGWLVAVTGGYDVDEAGVSTDGIPAFIDKDRLIAELRAAVEAQQKAPRFTKEPRGNSRKLPHLDSNQEPSD